MKILNLSTALITIVALLSFTQKDADTKITVTVTGFKNAKGNYIANLYDKSEGFQSCFNCLCRASHRAFASFSRSFRSLT